MFVDSVKIYVKAGDGGDGVVAFRHEKYVAMGGPSGGNGGKGGSVIMVGEEGLTTLLDFRFNRKIKAERGQDGMSRDMFGKAGSNTYVKVPIGTTIMQKVDEVVKEMLPLLHQEIPLLKLVKKVYQVLNVTFNLN